MKWKRADWRTLALGAIAVSLVVTEGAVAREDGTAVQRNSPQQVEESAPVTPLRFDGDVRDLPSPVEWKPGDPIREIPRRFYPKPGMISTPDPLDTSDPLAPAQRQISESQTRGTGGGFTVPTRNFDGIGFTGVNPPDPTGAAGPNHYIQSINGSGGSRVRIFDKAEPTPNVLATFTMDSLGSGACASGFSDPIVLYDRHADRFMISEFATAGNNLCIYVSQTPDPVSGGWYFYQFSTPSFPDYPKYGTWPTDANGGGGSYVMTANDGGPGVYAFDRGKMLNGDPATFVRISTSNLPGFGFEAPTPADLDGSQLPPTGAPAIIMRHRDTESHSGPAAPADLLEWWTFDVDWINSANTTLTQQTSIDVAEFDSSLCGLTSFNCFPQPGTGTTLDPLREVIMFRLQYMNHIDGTETLVGSFVVDVNGSNLGGVRWFELRGGSPNWTLYQEGTYTPDSVNRFMSSIAMDQSKNIGLAYNVSSSSTFPGLRYTGRLEADALGTMSQPESTIFDGTASNASNRYGDYSHMALDPEDDCTFWFTGEANPASSWKTQVASFRFEACGCDLFPTEPVLSGDINGDNRVDLQWDDSDLPSVTSYEVLRSRTAGGPYEKIAEIDDTSPGVAEGLGYDFSDFDVSGGIDYFYVVRSTDGLACTSQNSNEIAVTATGACTLEPVFAGLAAVDDPAFGVCRLDLSWAPAAAECGGPVTYNVYRSVINGFIPGPSNLIASGLAGTMYSDINQLSDGTFYYYVVRAVDQANGVEDENNVQIMGEADGVSGGICSPGSSCAENPIVDITPNGPLTVCVNGGGQLTANLTGGTGPFSYQWFADGQPIPGANAASYTPLQLGTQSFNVRVSAEACSDEVFDGLDTQITRVNQPFFNGLTSATNPQTADCSVNLGWNAATSVCPGPVTYSVFRDTTSPVAPTIENLVAGGLTGTSYTDAEALVNSQEYFYTVKAVDAFTSVFDDNTVTLAVTPDGPGSGFSPGYFEDFTDTAVLADWELKKGPGPHTCGLWEAGTAAAQRPSGTSGNYLVANNDCVPGATTSATATSPIIDMDIPGLLSVELQVNVRFDYNPTDSVETGSVQVWDGTQWVVVWQSAQADVNTQLTLDVGAYAVGNADFQVRISYQDAVNDNFMSFDNVRLTNYIVNACATPASGPPSVPRGSLQVDKNASGADLSWNASCGAADYNLLYGNLTEVSTYTLQGGVCSLGGAGSFSWNSLPAGDIFFLLVGVDGSGTEGSWGRDRNLVERNGNTPSGQCGVTLKNSNNICF